jgi:exonuclease III
MKIIYWNTNNISKINQIIDICSTERPDIFFLSEIDEKLLEDNNQYFNDINYEYFLNPGSERVKILKKLNLKIDLGLQHKYYSFISMKENNLNLISLHFPSQIYQPMESLKEFIRNFRNTIDNRIGSPLEERIILIGDFNVNPFEKPMLDFDGFSATNNISSKGEVRHLGQVRTLYYNPTWQLYSNKKFPGTMYYKRPSSSSYDILEHHLLDQVIISIKLLNEIKSEQIKTIERTSNFVFKRENSNKIYESDHLPLSYQINLQKYGME